MTRYVTSRAVLRQRRAIDIWLRNRYSFFLEMITRFLEDLE